MQHQNPGQQTLSFGVEAARKLVCYKSILIYRHHGQLLFLFSSFISSIYSHAHPQNLMANDEYQPSILKVRIVAARNLPIMDRATELTGKSLLLTIEPCTLI